MNSTGKLTEIDKDEAKIVRLMHHKGDPYNPAGHYIFISFKGICHQLLLSMDPPNNPPKENK